MVKETFYFSHDYNARTDPKIRKLLVSHGIAGYGIYWALVEDLYNNANALPTDYDSIAYDLRVDKHVLISIINDYGLFVIEGDFFKSLSVEKRMQHRADKSEKARMSAKTRWENANASKTGANALRSECDSNAIKERKGKEIKDIERDARKKVFYEDVKSYSDLYKKEMLKSFYDYWTELNKSGTKMRFELERTWETKKRLITWASREKVVAPINGHADYSLPNGKDISKKFN